MGTLANALPFSSSTLPSSKSRMVAIPVITTAAILLGSIVLLFARLGHYSLWTDEASTAITAAGVWKTGDTSAWLDDRNLLTYRDGLLLKNQKDRYTSPLQFYLAAPFIGLLGRTAFAARLPFALCGLATVCVILRWLRQTKPPALVWLAAVIILLSNASFFLFQRQCRYYALATFLSTFIAYLYCNWTGHRRTLWMIAIAMSALLASQYLDYAALVGCLLIDYGIWGRRQRAIRGKDWLVLIVPQLLTAAIVCPIWNPIARAANAAGPALSTSNQIVSAGVSQPWFADYLKLYWWNLRDLLACDFVILPLLVILPVLYFRQRNAWLLRAPLALMLFIAAIAFFTAHPLTAEGNAEVRYLAPALPLCVGIGIVAVMGINSLPVWTRSILLGFAGLSILLQGSALGYYAELLHPQTEPYTPMAEWINRNLPANSTVYISPDMCVSPTMWNAPRATYVWQLSDPPRPDYQALPAKYFKGRIPPDCLIGFGPYIDEIEQWRARFDAQGVHYELAATIPVYFKEMYRPELNWRSFQTIQPAPGEEIRIYQLAKR